MEQMTFEQGEALLWRKLGIHKSMAQAAASPDRVTVRYVSCLFYDGCIWFKTDKNFSKTQLLLENPRTALCAGGVQVEGEAQCMGLVAEEPDQRFAKLYNEYMFGSYNHHAHLEDEIFFRITPTFVEIWDTAEENESFQIFLDYKTRTIEYRKYD